MIKEEKLFTRKYNELRFLLLGNSDYDLLKSSAIIRLFIIDETPLVDIVNRNYRLKILFKVDSTFNLVFQEGSKLLYTPTQIGKMKIKNSMTLKELDKSKFLKLGILETKNEIFSVIQIVKFLANREGAVHFESTEKKKEDKLAKVDEGILIQTIREIERIVLLALDDLKQNIIQIPENLPRFARFLFGPDGHAFFQGTKQFMETRNMNKKIKNGFGVLSEIKILQQPRSGTRVIYEIGGDKCFNFKIQYHSNGVLTCNAKINSTKNLKVSCPDFGKFFQDKWVSLITIIEFEDQTATFYLYINSQLKTSSKSTFKIRYSKVNEQTFGGNLKGKQNAAFDLIELMIINDKISNEKKKALIEYFEGSWKA